MMPTEEAVLFRMSLNVPQVSKPKQQMISKFNVESLQDQSTQHLHEDRLNKKKSQWSVNVQDSMYHNNDKQ